MKGEKAAIEMSVGTIVTIVLSMTMLIGGIVLVKNIIGGASDVANLNNEQILKQVGNLYGEDKKLAVWPDVNDFEISPGKPRTFAIVLKNLVTGTDSANIKFSYDMTFDSFEGCGFGAQEAASWFKGRTGSDIQIAPKEESVQKIQIAIPEGTSLCSFRATVQAKQDDKPYANEQMFVNIG